ncbi:MAG: S-layer homology domain-containing protein [Pleurocapsa sp.]
MQSHQTNKIIIIGGAILALVSGCSNGSAIESFIAADPQLKAQLTSGSVAEAQIATSKNTNNSAPVNNISENSPITESEGNIQANLPENFPQNIPIYNVAELNSIESGLTIDAGKVKLRSPDSVSQIVNYYQTELVTSGWTIVQPFTRHSTKTTQKAIATKDNLKITLAVTPTANNTDLTIAYEPVKEEINSTVSSTTGLTESLVRETQENAEDKINSPTSNPKSNHNTSQNNNNTNTAIAKNSTTAVSETSFTDLDEVPEQLKKYVEEVAALGILTPYTGDANAGLNKFAPNQPVTRAEYASWLIAANNKYYADSPGYKIHVANKTSQSAFKDISVTNPDFGVIQGLAEAGLVPSMLTADSSKLLFQPDAPLKREDLILWKVPLDIRKALPQASIEAIQESWGFQDAASIEPDALKALFADYQNGELANVKRLFGYTTLFQPKKTITRAEAAASLWYFGFQGDGITAPEVSSLNNE